MNPNVSRIQSADGSDTLFSEMFHETYHSIHGAITESMHVFIKTGLHHCSKNTINVMEIGFGTGLNAWLTSLESINLNKTIHYTGIEKFPLSFEIWNNLYFPDYTSDQIKIFTQLHQTSWNETIEILPTFTCRKIEADITQAILPNLLDLVYFDAFSPTAQPELWSAEQFGNIYEHMSPGGILVTYCAKGEVRRILQKTGFLVERLPGPPPKREMLRATK